ncbi:hypothetical protein FISHEDRAFT_58094 [Fistulina hepatica ATCC 64428]|uniref:RING-type domain-containing protein n=1 Tax=Fistulina hepatica ATCC 64428 TaxID=1128425 RepID=A0A0D7AHR9_9AGAR|nr:hypothetical protein FISHEDRAFT_58094 [Fistulina hepatica ATCC 64428]
MSSSELTIASSSSYINSHKRPSSDDGFELRESKKSRSSSQESKQHTRNKRKRRKRKTSIVRACALRRSTSVVPSSTVGIKQDDDGPDVADGGSDRSKNDDVVTVHFHKGEGSALQTSVSADEDNRDIVDGRTPASPIWTGKSRLSKPPEPVSNCNIPSKTDALQMVVDQLKGELAAKNQLVENHQSALKEALLCKICFDIMTKPYALTCGHMACHSCLVQWFTAPAPNQPANAILRKKTCPHCRAVIRHRPSEVYVVKDLVADVTRHALIPDLPPPLPLPVPTAPAVAQHDDPWHDIFPDTTLQDNRERFGWQDWDDGGIFRCPDCGFEILDGVCLNCNRAFDDNFEDGSIDDLDFHDDDSEVDSFPPAGFAPYHPMHDLIWADLDDIDEGEDEDYYEHSDYDDDGAHYNHLDDHHEVASEGSYFDLDEDEDSSYDDAQDAYPVASIAVRDDEGTRVDSLVISSDSEDEQPVHGRDVRRRLRLALSDSDDEDTPEASAPAYVGRDSSTSTDDYDSAEESLTPVVSLRQNRMAIANLISSDSDDERGRSIESDEEDGYTADVHWMAPPGSWSEDDHGENDDEFYEHSDYDSDLQ